MKGILSVKTLLRSWVKTAVTFILIAAVTFTLFSQVAEYIATKREFESGVEMYKGTGTVEVHPAIYRDVQCPYYIEADPRVDAYPAEEYNEMGYAKITSDMVNTIEALPGVSRIYKRYMTGGINESIYRTEDWPRAYDFAARLIVEGTLTYVSDPPTELFGEGVFGYYTDRPGFYFDDCRILAGQAELEEVTLMNDGHSMGACYDHDNYLKYEDNGGEVPMDNGFRYEWTTPEGRITSMWTPNYIYYEDYLDSLKIGNRYVFVLRFDRAPLQTDESGTSDAYIAWVKSLSCSIYDFLSENWCPAIWDIEDAPENYLELPEYAPLKTCVEITNSDIHTLDVVYADDMSVISRVKDNKMTLAEGRWLTPEDTENGAKVCMVSKVIAEENGLHVGDTLPIKLGDELFEQYYGLGAVAATPERFADNWTDTELEIVGIYSDPIVTQWREPNWSYSNNTVFVPLSLLPVGEEKLEEHLYSPAEFSFEVGNAWDIEMFIEECIPKIEAMGLTVTFDDGGWTEVVKSYRSAQQLAMVRIALLACVTLLSTGFIVYLFIGRKKKDYAVMRSLGTPKGRTAKALIAPLMVLSAAGVAVGVASGIAYMAASAGSVSAASIVSCVVGELALTVVFAAFMLHKLGKRSPLELLQNRRGQKRKAAIDVHAETLADASGSEHSFKPASVKKTQNISANTVGHKPKKPHHVRFVMRYIFRHIRRQTLKSLLAILLAALLVGAITKFAYMKIVYNDLRTETVVNPRFISSLSLNKVPALERDGLALDLYYEDTLDAELHYGQYNWQPATFALTNNIGQYTNETYEIEFAPGWDESCMDEFSDALILGETVMETCGYELGDKVLISRPGKMDDLMLKLRSSFPKEFPDLEFSYEKMYEVYEEYLTYSIDQMSSEYTIVGVIRTPSNAFSEMGFTPGRPETESVIGAGATLDLAEFRLADNARVEEMRELGEKLAKGLSGSFIMDTSKLESVIRTSDLLNGLYPAAVAVAILIEAAICVLIILQTSKDAAIMRAQGTTKRKTSVILSVEQILLSIIGIAIGLGVMVISKEDAIADVAPQLSVFIGTLAGVVIIASVVSASVATHKNILELLQTKE